MNMQYFEDHPKERAKYLKLAYLEAKRSDKDNTAFTYQQIQALRDMAKYDVWPDGRFGDDACSVWSLFHNYEKAQA